MRILLAATPVIGHINPIMAIGAILRNAGHEVIFQTVTAFKEHIEASGIAFRPLAHNADVDYRDLDRLVPERKLLQPGPEMLLFDFLHFFIEPIPSQHLNLVSMIDDWQPDVIIADNAFLGTLPSLLLPRKARPPIIHCGFGCLFTERDDGAPQILGLPPARNDQQRAEYSKLRESIEAAVLRPAREATNQQLAALGMPELPVGFLGATVHLADAYFHPTVPGFEYPSQVFKSPKFHFIGGLDLPQSPISFPEWLGELDGKTHNILLTQGTLANFDFAQLIIPALTAMAGRDDITIIVSTGNRPLSELPHPLPPNVRAATFLPFADVMPKIDLLVTNGGYGTVSQALRFGVPMVIAGTTEDKAETAARVAWAGVGINLATNAPGPEMLKAAIDSVLGQQSYRLAAARLAKQFRGFDAQRLVPLLVEECVEHHSRPASGKTVLYR